MGGGIALQLAIRHPDLVRRLVLASTSFRSDGMHAAAVEMFPSITPDLFAGFRSKRGTADGANLLMTFRSSSKKLTRLDTTPFAWPQKQDIRAIAAPTLIVLGDSDGIRLEHAVQLFAFLGGGVTGDLVGLPKSQLAVLPATSRFVRPAPGSWTASSGCCR